LDTPKRKKKTAEALEIFPKVGQHFEGIFAKIVGNCWNFFLKNF
jgi:hypothetical protein